MDNGSCFLNWFCLDTFLKPFYGSLKHPLEGQTSGHLMNHFLESMFLQQGLNQSHSGSGAYL